MQQIGPYVLSRRIGAGGMAEVWLAHRATRNASKTLAVKLLAPNLACKAQYRAMFLDEARLSMLLNHSNVVQVFDVGEDRGECYMAMEWIDGANLAQLQAALWSCGRSLPVAVAMYITGEILRALDHAHGLVYAGAATIVHRDVSPANVMLSLAGEVKLTDFGVARFGTEETSGVHVKGKLRYMAPEQLRGRSRAGTVDIFATGAVLHEMLDGVRFRSCSGDEAQLIGAISAGTVPELIDGSRIAEPLDALRRGMLAPDPDSRIASARAALLLLRRCPGYRDASHELEALVRWYRAIEPGDRGCRPFDSGARLSTPRTSQAACVRRRVAAISVALGGLCVGCLGVGFAVSTVEPELAPANVLAAADWRRQPLSWPTKLVPVDRQPRAAIRPRLASATLEPELEPEPEPKPEPRPKKPLAISLEPVEVKFVAGAFKFAYLKIGNQRLLIEPDGKLALVPGSHRVHVRFSADGQWTYFGKIRIRPNHPHLVKLVQPNGLDVKILRR